MSALGGQIQKCFLGFCLKPSAQVGICEYYLFFLLRGFYISGAETTVRSAETTVRAAETTVRSAET